MPHNLWVLVSQPGVEPELLLWEHQVLPTGPPENFQSQNINQHELCQSSPSWHQYRTPPNSLQAPVLEWLRPNNQKNRNTAPPISRQGPKVELTSQTPQNMPIDTALPTRRTRLISLPPERLHKPLDWTFPPRGSHQKQEEVQSCSLQSGDHKHRQNEITGICYRKEKRKTLQDQLNKEEIGNLPEKYQSNDSKDDARSWENKGTDRESTRKYKK